MNFLNGLKNFLTMINDNWTTILIIIGLCIGLYKKIENYLSKSDDEKITIAKDQLKQVILKMITDAEQDYTEWEKAGSIKRSQVIKEIFSEYPILSKISDQDQLIKWIDEQIDNALVDLRKIIQEQ